MGRPVKLRDIPEVNRSGERTSWIDREVQEFLESKSEAWELKTYGSHNAAASTAARLNRKDIGVRAIVRGNTVYLLRS